MKVVEQFQNYVVLDSNETIGLVIDQAFQFQNYVVLDSNETEKATYIKAAKVLELCCFRQ